MKHYFYTCYVHYSDLQTHYVCYLLKLTYVNCLLKLCVLYTLLCVIYISYVLFTLLCDIYIIMCYLHYYVLFTLLCVIYISYVCYIHELCVLFM